MHELLWGDGPVDFVGVGTDDVETVERYLEVVVHQFAVEVCAQLLRSAEFAYCEADGVLLATVEFLHKVYVFHAGLHEVVARMQVLVESACLGHEAEHRGVLDVEFFLLLFHQEGEGVALGDIDWAGCLVGGTQVEYQYAARHAEDGNDGKKLIAMYSTHSDESYVPEDGTSSKWEGAGIYDVGDSLKEALAGE